MKTPTEECKIHMIELTPLCLTDIEVFRLYFLVAVDKIIQGGDRFVAKVELKQPVVQAIVEDIKDAQSAVLVNYCGLTVAEDTALRKQLREAGVIYKVCKNTMMKRAFEGTDFAQLDEFLEGPSAIAISKDDATAPARIICKFAKDAKALEVKAGIVEGTLYDQKGVEELSNIPAREVLLSKLLGSLQSPITNLARVLNQIAEKDGAEVPAVE